ncbi:MAG: serine/threonine-protein kinase [Ktedonobacterales bacterium]
MRYRRYSSGPRPDTSVSQSSPPVRPTTWRRRYQNLQPLAHGGMAQVYRAFDRKLDRQIALKVLPREFSADPVMLERFRLETLRMQALQHPHIVPILDCGLYRDRFFFSMPLYPTTLQQQVRQNGMPPLSVTVRLIEQLAAALDCAHSQGVVHRDIKPTNILLDHSGLAYLADFGISKSTSRAESRLKTGILIREMEYEEEQTSLLFATPDYCAPEHLMGHAVDARTDVFGLALVLYELVTGHKPYCHDDDPDPIQLTREQYANLLYGRIQHERPIRPSQLVQLPTRLMAKNVDATILRALDPQPHQRYGSAGLLAAALGAALTAG